MEIERENEKFIALIEQYKIIMDKSQNSAIKEAKQVAISELIVKWAAISGKTLTQKSILKKLSNLKVRTKAVDGKKQPLCNWQTKLLTIMTDIDDDEQVLLPDTAAGVREKPRENTEESPSSNAETVHVDASSIVDGYETLETKQMTNNQLKRVILLEQFKILKLKRMKMERGLKTAAVSDGSKVEIEYVGFDNMADM